MSLASGLVGLAILVGGERLDRLLLAQVGLTSLLNSVAFYWLNPYPFGDEILQYHYVSTLTATGHLSTSFGWYYSYPAYPLLMAAWTALAGLSPLLYGILPRLVIAASPLPAYALARELGGTKAGLLAGLFVAATNFPGVINPQGLGFFFFLLAAWIAFRIVRSRATVWIGVFWVAGLAMLFLHPVLTASVILFYIAVEASSRLKRQARRSSHPLPTASFALVFVAYALYIVFPLFVLLVQAIFVPEIYGPLSTTKVPKTSEALLVIAQFELASLVYPIFIGLSIHGALRAFSDHEYHHSQPLFAGLLAVAVVPTLQVLLQNYNLQPTRLLEFIYATAAITAALSLVPAMESAQRRRLAVFGVTCIVTAAAFVGTTSYLNGNGNQLLSSAVPKFPLQNTETLLESRSFLMLTPTLSRIFMDYGSLLFIGGPPERTLYPLPNRTLGLLQFPLSNGSCPGNYAVFNTFSAQYATYTNAGLIRLDPRAVTEAKEGVIGGSRIFDSGPIVILAGWGCS